jgi:hypothetical protein
VAEGTLLVESALAITRGDSEDEDAALTTWRVGAAPVPAALRSLDRKAGLRRGGIGAIAALLPQCHSPSSSERDRIREALNGVI